MPRYQYILDDSDAAFSVEGDWREVTYDSGLWEASPPFYHDWGAACHEAVAGRARWDLWIPEEDTYTIDAWWPAAPASDTWNGNVVYEVVAGGRWSPRPRWTSAPAATNGILWRRFGLRPTTAHTCA
ncbi:MAG: hypothetical protein M5R40_11825 [Anaerolineae bacterium]|nr:hypothetical protein [Anaerolineae bacterium]